MGIYSIYQNTFIANEKVPSIHNFTFEKMPVDAKEDNKQLIKNGEEVCDIVSRVRGFKTDNKISLKTKLEKITICTENEGFIKSCEDYLSEDKIQKLLLIYSILKLKCKKMK